MLLACYNWKLEKAFLTDIEATLPEPGMTFEDDDSEANDKNDSTKSNDDKDDALNNEIFKSDIESDIRATNEIINNDETKITEDITKPDDNDSNANASDKISKSQECDDPLQRTKSYTRKTDSEKNLSGVPIQDFSDPLHSTLSVDDEVFLPKEEVKFIADDTHTDR